MQPSWWLKERFYFFYRCLIKPFCWSVPLYDTPPPIFSLALKYIDSWPHHLLLLDRSQIANLVQGVLPQRQRSETTQSCTHNLCSSNTTCFCFVGPYYWSPSALSKSGNTGSKLKKRQMAQTFGRLHLSTGAIWFKYPWVPWGGREPSGLNLPEIN